MADEFRAFEQAYGCTIPVALKSLYEDRELLARAPRRIVVPGKPFAVVIQYYRHLTDYLVAEDVARHWFAFAVNDDGWDMLVDLTGPDLPVLQREAGEVDPLDFTLAEFLAAATQPGSES